MNTTGFDMAADQTARVCKTYAVGATSITKDQHSYRPFDKQFWLTRSIPPTATRCISITRCVKPSRASTKCRDYNHGYKWPLVSATKRGNQSLIMRRGAGAAFAKKLGATFWSNNFSKRVRHDDETPVQNLKSLVSRLREATPNLVLQRGD